MAEKAKGYEQLHISECPAWIKKALKEWGEAQEPKLKMSPVVVMILKKWIESDFTTPRIGEEVQLKSQEEIEKQRKMDALQKQIAELQNS